MTRSIFSVLLFPIFPFHWFSRTLNPSFEISDVVRWRAKANQRKRLIWPFDLQESVGKAGQYQAPLDACSKQLECNGAHWAPDRHFTCSSLQTSCKRFFSHRKNGSSLGHQIFVERWMRAHTKNLECTGKTYKHTGPNRKDVSQFLLVMTEETLRSFRTEPFLFSSHQTFAKTHNTVHLPEALHLFVGLTYHKKCPSQDWFRQFSPLRRTVNLWTAAYMFVFANLLVECRNTVHDNVLDALN